MIHGCDIQGRLPGATRTFHHLPSALASFWRTTCERGIIAADEIQHVILLKAIFEDMFLGEGPFEVTAGGPIGNVPLSDCEVGFIEGADNIFVGNAIPEHAVDHVALEFGEAGNPAIAADFAALGGGGDRMRVSSERGAFTRAALRWRGQSLGRGRFGKDSRWSLSVSCRHSLRR